jgi:hypothetical protein
VRCIVCHRTFDFDAGETALILKHVAYSYDFVHPGVCAEEAGGWIFPEPGYDSAAFVHDRERRRVLRTTPADGWLAILPGVDGRPVTLEPLRCWAVVERADGSRHTEALVRDSDWLNEPGGAEFPRQQRYIFDAMAAARAA